MSSLACITGATSGIGEELSYLLANKQIPLLLTGRNYAKLEELKENLSVHTKVITIEADLADNHGRQKVLEAIYNYVPTLLINNAGRGIYGSFDSQDPKIHIDLLRVNNEALVALTYACIKALKEHQKKGIIMNISSVAAFYPLPYIALYSASKAFVNHFSQAVDLEMKDEGIRVLASCPGAIKTNFRERSGGREVKEFNAYEMTAKFAAQEIYRQIENKTPLHIFDWKYRLLTRLFLLIPKSLQGKMLKKNLKKIYAK